MNNSPVMTFGKYKGQPIKDVITKDPRYCLWAHNNVSFFKMMPDQIQECKLRTRSGPDEEDCDSYDDDSYGGMDYSDFGNN